MVQKLTYMSWTNEYYGQYYRAIALVDCTGYFDEAINCMRDGDMGTPDERGIYSRHWYGDYVQNDEHMDLRPANLDEVRLYKSYVNSNFNGKAIECLGYTSSEVYVFLKKESTVRKFLRLLKGLIF